MQTPCQNQQKPETTANRLFFPHFLKKIQVGLVNQTISGNIDHMYSSNETSGVDRPMTTAPELKIATIDDIPTILAFIRELADYEHMLDQVVATEESLRYWLFDQHKAEVLLALRHGKPVGFALFFHNFSTFLGKAGIYLEDLYVRKEARGTGCGKALLRELARITVERGCGRLEWNCLDWNQPSIDFYRSLGARPMEDWTLYRLTGEELLTLARS